MNNKFLELINSYRSGGIHINPKNKGKFTASAKRAGMSVQQFANHVLANKEDYSSTQIRRANFARNARHFKHQDGGEIVYSGEIDPVIITPDKKYNEFLISLPKNLQYTPENKYRMYKLWELSGKPKDFENGKQIGIFTWDDSDNSWHGSSVARDRKTDIYHFIKPKDHETVHYELDWYNKGLETLDGGEQRPLVGEDRKFWEEFRQKYRLDDSEQYYRYVPRK